MRTRIVGIISSSQFLHPQPDSFYNHQDILYSTKYFGCLWTDQYYIWTNNSYLDWQKHSPYPPGTVTGSWLKNLDVTGAQSGNATSLYCRAVMGKAKEIQANEHITNK